jgi:tetratricopeptide (TPR) repeat protein
MIIVSCHSRAQEEREKNFDITLLKRNEKFRLAGDYDSLVNLNKRYYRQAGKMDYEEGKALCYINLAELNISLENYQKSQILFDKANDILKDSDNNIHKARFYNVYGRFNLELRRVDKALEYNNKAMEYINNSDPSVLKDDLVFNIDMRQALCLMEKKR